jgi:RNA methyltransferase, TrmH family
MLSKNQIKNINNLHQKKFRARQGLFIAEGPKVLDELLHTDIKITEIYALESWIERNITVLMQKQLRYEVISEKELAAISGLQAPNEVLAVCGQQNFTLADIDKKARLFLYLDNLSDPGNLGTIVRMAEWFGLSQVFCSDNCAEVYNPKVVQSTMGSLGRVKVHYMSLGKLKSALSVHAVLGATLAGENIYTMRLPERCIVVIGSESHGISAENLQELSTRITIPKAEGAKTESLNAAAATSVILSEFFRKRNFV